MFDRIHFGWCFRITIQNLGNLVGIILPKQWLSAWLDLVIPLEPGPCISLNQVLLLIYLLREAQDKKREEFIVFDELCKIKSIRNPNEFHIIRPRSAINSMLNLTLGPKKVSKRAFLCQNRRIQLTFQKLLRPRHFTDDILKCIFFNENVWNSDWNFIEVCS